MAMTKVVLAVGKAVTMGFPPTLATPAGVVYESLGSNPAGSPWIPAKMVARRTEMKVKAADAVPSLLNMLKVRGREHSQQTMATMMPKLTV